MIQRDGDGLPTMGEEAEIALSGYKCFCGVPTTPGVMHRSDGPCYIPGGEPVTLPSTVACGLGDRTHKWRWKTDITSGLPSMSHAVCVHCGLERKATNE